MTSQADNPAATRLTLALAAAIFILAAIPFAPALSAGLLDFDDVDIIQSQTGYRGLTADNLGWMFSTTHMGHYQPLTWLSYTLDYSLRGMEPAGFHATNILIHALNAVLVFLLARRLLAAGFVDRTPSRSVLGLAAAATALLFAIHPLRVESVAWVTERRDVLSTFFLLLTALAYLRAFPARSTAPVSRAWYAASISLLLLSLLSKAWGMSFFVLALILDWYPLRRLPSGLGDWFKPPARGVLLQKVPFTLLGIAFAVQAARAQASVAFTAIPLEQWPIGARILQACYGLMFYIQKLVAPINLAALYELEPFKPLNQPRFILGVLFALTLAAAAIILRRRLPAFTAAALAYTIILSPVLGFSQSGPQLVADRYSYIANISWALLIAAGVVHLLTRRFPSRAARAGAALAAVAVLSLLAGLTWRQSRVWHDTETLFAHAISSGADGPIIRQYYAAQLLKAGRVNDAIANLQTATRLEPRYGEPWFKLANALKDQNRLPEAEQAYLAAAKGMSDSWRPNLMLGILYIAKMDRPKDAAERFRAAIANAERSTPPASALPYLMLAGALDELGDEAGARTMLQKAAEYPETREQALQHLREMDATPGEQRP